MRRADYMLCAKCKGKAYYDADTDYGAAAVYALCHGCQADWRIAFTPVEQPPLTDLHLAWPHLINPDNGELR